MYYYCWFVSLLSACCTAATVGSDTSSTLCIRHLRLHFRLLLLSLHLLLLPFLFKFCFNLNIVHLYEFVFILELPVLVPQLSIFLVHQTLLVPLLLLLQVLV